jgi:carboxylesterase type B
MAQPYIIGNNDKELGAQEIMADAEFTCASAQVSNSRAKAGMPVWRYRFFGGGPAEPGAAGGLAGLAASAQSFHGSELSYVFGGVQASSLLSRPSPLKTAVSNEMMSVWAAFAKDPAKGPLQHGWPLYNAKGISSLSIKDGNLMESRRHAGPAVLQD